MNKVKAGTLDIAEALRMISEIEKKKGKCIHLLNNIK